MLFIMSMNFTERGIREIRDDPQRAQAAQALARKCGCDIRQIYVTSGEYDLMQIIETTNGDNIPDTRWPTAAWGLSAAVRPAPGRWTSSRRSSPSCRRRRPPV